MVGKSLAVGMQVVGERAGEQLAVLVVDEMLEECAAETLHDGADRLAVQGHRIDDAADVLDRDVVESSTWPVLGSTATWAA